MTQHTLQSLEERELELALREAELNRREAAIRRGEVDIAAVNPAPRALTPYDVELERELEARLAGVERRERELGQVVEAVEAQRRRLEAVRREYEERRAALTARAREVEAELALLKEERAKVAEDVLLSRQPRTVVPPALARECRDAGSHLIRRGCPRRPGSEGPRPAHDRRLVGEAARLAARSRLGNVSTLSLALGR